MFPGAATQPSCCADDVCFNGFSFITGFSATGSVEAAAVNKLNAAENDRGAGLTRAAPDGLENKLVASVNERGDATNGAARFGAANLDESLTEAALSTLLSCERGAGRNKEVASANDVVADGCPEWLCCPSSDTKDVVAEYAASPLILRSTELLYT